MSLDWRCWTAANGDGTTLFLGRGEVHEELRLFDGEVSFPERNGCPRSKLVRRGLATEDGLRLGLSRAAVEELVGGSSGAGSGWYERLCFTKRAMTEKEKVRLHAVKASANVGVTSRLVVLEDGDKAIGLRVSWSEVY